MRYVPMKYVKRYGDIEQVFWGIAVRGEPRVRVDHSKFASDNMAEHLMAVYAAQYNRGAYAHTVLMGTTRQ